MTTLKVFKADLPVLTVEQTEKFEQWMKKSLLSAYIRDDKLFGVLWEEVSIHTIQGRITKVFKYMEIRKPYQLGWLVPISQEEYDKGKQMPVDSKDALTGYRALLYANILHKDIVAANPAIPDSLAHRKELEASIIEGQKHGASKAMVKNNLEKLPTFPRLDLTVMQVVKEDMSSGAFGHADIHLNADEDRFMRDRCKIPQRDTSFEEKLLDEHTRITSTR
jgi:hypothetical protein